MRTLPRILLIPSVSTLLLWMIVPLSMTIYFSFIRYNLLYPERTGFNNFDNYSFFIEDSAFLPSIFNTLILVGSILIITISLGIALAVLINTTFAGRGIVRVMMISPFFIMPTVNALVWKNLLMNPVYGIFAYLAIIVGLQPIDWLSDYPLFSIIVMLSWQWTPFALLIFMTSLQSQDKEQLEAAVLDGAGFWSQFKHLTLPHLARPIAIVMMIQTIFHLSIFAEIFITTSGGPGYDSTNMAFLIFAQALLKYDVGAASVGGIFTIILANIIALFLIRAIGKTLVR